MPTRFKAITYREILPRGHVRYGKVGHSEGDDSRGAGSLAPMGAQPARFDDGIGGIATEYGEDHLS